MNASALFEKIRVKNVIGTLDIQVNDITADSRTAKEGSIFVASKGYTVDSHKFCQDVIEQGCRIIVVNREVQLEGEVTQVVVPDTLRVASLLAHHLFDFPSHQLTIYGVTGTNGKTSIATMIHLIYRKLNKNSAYLGTNGFQINETKTKGANTTPETVSLTKKIKEAVESNAEAMTMEVSSHGLALGRLRGVEFDVAIFSNLTQDHLDFHGTMEAYGHAKSLLFSQLGEDLAKEKYIVLNNDDDFSKYLASVTPYEVFTYGIENEAQFMAKNINESLHGVEFDLSTPFGDYHVKSPYVGRFNISNIMAAMIAVWSKGASFENIVNAVTTLEPVEGRLEVLDPSLPIDLIIDYAHTADGMNKLIDAVKPFVKQKLIFLVGMAGERDMTKTPEMGKVACRADYVIFTPDNPANDDPKMLTAELAKGATHNNYVEFEDRAEGIKHAIEAAQPGDTVVLASKGREPYQIMPGHVKVPHRDDLIGLEAAYKKFGGGSVED
ncbi:UDP-N-acetylmuramoyl-L-alanyl-D-glutamate--L-lysine ligase [Staphylococcus saccharolyticus]|uniref:UDP-N-acetylmuramoyl-L-alanyl-D-glutamate--L-lysine ligase n=1 Tax=Staphylococcus saccharolyticus TaxID=33028 RepID=A0A380H8J2_9STAP|nr:UDP-N-acetylmuramoyl-L-alanyl-D-glutamate--L-lysine ligase [Staphylococcus saccharolyticus]MBL7565601.1 UDP-N-acetylmuramoyl-L-alanyl-D-glutamate--L-lysine ligase [Staphylococcus saccharolyticus]MBL7572316.1 UDP-N-acetylmuramoyl-L-alanyl-D-glutamate--L-lysine ligase [Staphylococcus saccharolyticus]QQB97863.1 UDP-N-acetylmuramoyl-L-alanyl-D-glutamate--L-lysine ligase [Staphylococcus saccharolyticus]RTX98901.1 UDP-N-acetylmuramoyl-L-alanyl-D-glutamate--L-lysine ligase [Staphylococcus saccharol